jgi:hypothetical protein
VSAPVALALQAAAYLRGEADFNRSWTDGRRGSGLESPGYTARRVEIAEQREQWADAIDAICSGIAGTAIAKAEGR